MARVLVVFDSKHGQTRRIARFIGQELEAVGHTVKVLDVAADEVPSGTVLAQYDGVIAGAPVYAGGYSKRVRDWAAANGPILSGMPSAFFSVCLGILQKDNLETQRREREIAREFIDQAGWRPKVLRIFAGSLPYTQYGWLMRWMMRRIVRKAGGDTDTSRDYEYTDWNEVRKFALEFGEMSRAGLPAPGFALDA